MAVLPQVNVFAFRLFQLPVGRAKPTRLPPTNPNNPMFLTGMAFKNEEAHLWFFPAAAWENFLKIVFWVAIKEMKLFYTGFLLVNLCGIC